MALDRGLTYFIPWSLSGTVGEWHFTENQAEPARVMDYGWYMSTAHYHRMMYEFVPPLDLQLSPTTLSDYTDSPSEDWTKGAIAFDGSRFGKVSDEDMRADIAIALYRKNKKGDLVRQKELPEEPWVLPEAISGEGDKREFPKDGEMRYPGKLRNTLIATTRNLLVAANLRADAAGGTILAKHDGKAGYKLTIDGAGKAVFTVAGGGWSSSVGTAASIVDGKWHHVLAEVDRESGRMTIYLDGRKSGEDRAALNADVSIDCRADFLVGKASDDGAYLKGAIDYMRVCLGTLEDAQTDIAELYEWQTNGPVKYDFAGNASVGRRDAGALERIR
jgi:hypothetical protein